MLKEDDLKLILFIYDIFNKNSKFYLSLKIFNFYIKSEFGNNYLSFVF